MPTTRRTFLAGSAATGALGLSLASEAAASAHAATHRVLSAAQAAALDAFGEVLLPGARAAGLSSFVDRQLALPKEEQALMIKYLGLPPPYTDFYAQGSAALDFLAVSRHARTFAALPANFAGDIVAAIAAGSPAPWNGPPVALFYFAVRNDALDVVYGTQAGFAKLGIPYMAHIVPPSRWPQ